LRVAVREGLELDILLPASAAVIAGGTDEEAAATRDDLQMIGGLIAQRIVDESVRVRWFASHAGRELITLAGPIGPVALSGGAAVLEEHEQVLLRLVTEAHSNAEIADILGIEETTVRSDLASLFGKIGVSTRADATALALAGSLV